MGTSTDLIPDYNGLIIDEFASGPTIHVLFARSYHQQLHMTIGSVVYLMWRISHLNQWCHVSVKLYHYITWC